MTPDLILSAAAVLTMDAARTVIPDGAMAIAQGAILATGPRAALLAAHPGVLHRAMPGHIVMPGLINAHAHSGMLRGTAEEMAVWDWLTWHINPMHRVPRAEVAEAASWLCYAESLLSGVTTVVDMWRYMEGAARAAEGLGNRLVAVPYVGARPDYAYFDTLDMNDALIEKRRRGGTGSRRRRWRTSSTPTRQDSGGPSTWRSGTGRGFHTHCSEAEIEVAEFLKRHGRRPMQVLDDLVFFETPRAMIAHAVWLNEAEVDLIARRPVSVAHNQVSNMKIASGIAPVAEFLAAGVPVGPQPTARRRTTTSTCSRR
mgnify:FL=1